MEARLDDPVVDRLDRLRRHGHRRLAGRPAGRSHRPSPGVRPHPAGVRGGHRRLGAGHVGGHVDRAAVHRRHRPGGRTARGVHSGQRVRAQGDPRSGGGGPGGVLGDRLDSGGADRLPGRAIEPGRLALGPRSRRHSDRLRRRDPLGAARVRPVPGVEGTRRAGRGRRARLRTGRRCRAGAQPRRAGGEGRRHRLDLVAGLPGPHHRALDGLVLHQPELLRGVHLDSDPAGAARVSAGAQPSSSP